MNAFKIIAAAATFALAGSAFAADAPVANAAASTAAANAAATAAAATANAGIAAATLNVPTVTINKSLTRSRAEVHAEAVQFVKNHKTQFAILLEHAK